jgi:two-component system, response regulator / RNA-binding antiterminator
MEMSDELQRENEALRQELARAKLKLAERVLVERAKGLLMKTHGFDEETAYRALRRTAMNSNRRIGEVAQRVIDGALDMADALR